MPPGRKRKRPLPAKMGKKRQYLTDNFSDLPQDSNDLKNGHLLFLYITNDKSNVKTERLIEHAYQCLPIRVQLQSLINHEKKFSDSTSESVMARYRACCCEQFELKWQEEQDPTLPVPQTPDDTSGPSGPQALEDTPGPSGSETLQDTPGSQTLKDTPGLQDTPGSQTLKDTPGPTNGKQK